MNHCSSLDRIAVLIPCYNEEKTIAKVINDFRNALPEAKIYVYNNNSKDRTAQIAEETVQLYGMNTNRAREM